MDANIFGEKLVKNVNALLTNDNNFSKILEPDRIVLDRDTAIAHLKKMGGQNMNIHKQLFYIPEDLEFFAARRFKVSTYFKDIHLNGIDKSEEKGGIEIIALHREENNFKRIYSDNPFGIPSSIISYQDLYSDWIVGADVADCSSKWYRQFNETVTSLKNFLNKDLVELIDNVEDNVWLNVEKNNNPEKYI